MPAELQTAADRLRAIFPDRTSVRIASEMSSSQLIVVAPPAIQRRIADILAQTKKSLDFLASPFQDKAYAVSFR